MARWRCLCAALAACNVNSGEGTPRRRRQAARRECGCARHPHRRRRRAPRNRAHGRARLLPPGADWQRIIAASDVVGMIIFNPNNGPGTTTDPAYTSAIAKARAAGILVLGYVATNYGKRAEADINADVNGYYDLYQPSGIYFAEGPMEADCTTLDPEYRRLTSLARMRDPQGRTWRSARASARPSSPSRI